MLFPPELKNSTEKTHQLQLVLKPRWSAETDLPLIFINFVGNA